MDDPENPTHRLISTNPLTNRNNSKIEIDGSAQILLEISFIIDNRPIIETINEIQTGFDFKNNSIVILPEATLDIA